MACINKIYNPLILYICMSFEILESHSIQKVGENQLSSITNENIMEDNLKLQIKNLNQHKYTKMMKNILLIKERCGSLCNENGMHQNLSIKVFDSATTFQKRPFSCGAIWDNSVFDKSSDLEDPLQILPKYLTDHFSYNGRVKMTSHYYDDRDTENHKSNSWGKYILLQ